MRRSRLMATPSLRTAAFLVAACLALACGCKDHTIPAVPAVPAVPPAITSPDDKARVAPDNKGLPEGASPDNFVEVKEMFRGYCYAGSRIPDKKACGGFGTSDNLPQPIRVERAGASASCYLLAQP